MKMMAKKPADRYQSMNDVAQALRQWAADRGSVRPAAAVFPAPGRLRERNAAHRPAVDAGRHAAQTPRFGELPRAVAEEPAAGPALDRHGRQLSIVRPFTRGLQIPAAKRIAKGFPIPTSAKDCCPRRRRWTLPAAPSTTNDETAVSLDDVLGGDATAAPVRGIGRSPDGSQTQAEERSLEMGLDRHRGGDARRPDLVDPRHLDCGP